MQYSELIDSIGGLEAVEQFYTSLKALIRFKSGKAIQKYLTQNITDLKKLKLLSAAALIGLRVLKAHYAIEQGTEIDIEDGE